jgi:hypothetical protein
MSSPRIKRAYKWEDGREEGKRIGGTEGRIEGGKGRGTKGIIEAREERWM